MERGRDRHTATRRANDTKAPHKPRRNDPPNKARMFAKLVLEGQINSALRYLSEQDSGAFFHLLMM